MPHCAKSTVTRSRSQEPKKSGHKADTNRPCGSINFCATISHCLYSSIAVGQGVGLPVIGRLLGHAQTQTTARYAHVDNDPALSAANAIGNVVGVSIG